MRATRRLSRPRRHQAARRHSHDTLTTAPIYCRGWVRRFSAGSFPARLNATIPLARVPALPGGGDHRRRCRLVGLSGNTTRTVSARRPGTQGDPRACVPGRFNRPLSDHPLSPAHISVDRVIRAVRPDAEARYSLPVDGPPGNYSRFSACRCYHSFPSLNGFRDTTQALLAGLAFRTRGRLPSPPVLL